MYNLSTMELSAYLKWADENMLEFSKRSGVSYGTVWRIINKKTTPRPKLALAIEKATNKLVTAKELVFGNISSSG